MLRQHRQHPAAAGAPPLLSAAAAAPQAATRHRELDHPAGAAPTGGLCLTLTLTRARALTLAVAVAITLTLTLTLPPHLQAGPSRHGPPFSLVRVTSGELSSLCMMKLCAAAAEGLPPLERTPAELALMRGAPT